MKPTQSSFNLNSLTCEGHNIHVNVGKYFPLIWPVFAITQGHLIPCSFLSVFLNLRSHYTPVSPGLTRQMSVC